MSRKKDNKTEKETNIVFTETVNETLEKWDDISEGTTIVCNGKNMGTKRDH